MKFLGSKVMQRVSAKENFCWLCFWNNPSVNRTQKFLPILLQVAYYIPLWYNTHVSKVLSESSVQTKFTRWNLWDMVSSIMSDWKIRMYRSFLKERCPDLPVSYSIVWIRSIVSRRCFLFAKITTTKVVLVDVRK